MYSCGPLHIVEQRLDDQLEPSCSSSVPIRDVALRTCRKQWMIVEFGERMSGISALMARRDDDDIYIYIHEVRSKSSKSHLVRKTIAEYFCCGISNATRETNLNFCLIFFSCEGYAKERCVQQI